MIPPRPSTTIIQGVTELVRAVAGMREEHSPIGTASIRRRLGRPTIVEQPSWGRKRSIRLSNEGSGVRLPGIDHLRVGDEIRLASSVWHRRIIPIGLTPDTYPDVVFEGFVICSRFQTEDGQHEEMMHPAALPFFRSLVADMGIPEQPIHHHWRQYYDCTVLGVTRSGSSTATDQGWSIDLEQVVPS